MTVSVNAIEEVLPWEDPGKGEQIMKRVRGNIMKRMNTLDHVESCIKEQEKRQKDTEYPGIRENAELCCKALYDLKLKLLQWIEQDKCWAIEWNKVAEGEHRVDEENFLKDLDEERKHIRDSSSEVDEQSLVE